MKKLALVLCLYGISLFGQSQPDIPTFIPRLPFQSEVIALPRNDGDFTLFYTYKIPYRLLVFERSDENFIAGFRVTVEILDEDSKLVARDIKDSRVSVDKFESTNDHSLFLQDFLQFKIPIGEYKISALISDKNSSGEMPLKPSEIKLESENVVLHPLVINSEQISCEEDRAFVLANAGGKVPFSSENFHLVIPVRDTSVNKLQIIIENNDEEIISTEVTESYTIPIGIAECEKQISVTRNEETILVKNFILRNVNERLSEGEVILSVEDEDNSIEESFTSNIVWFNKPYSLLDPEKAIEYLSFIESDSVVYSLLKQSSDDYPELLSDYWSKYDPTPETVFNEVMSEYYNRVDFAVKEFRGIGNGNGAKTDRGVVYIKFGKPERIERSSNSLGQVVEVWTYPNSDRKFSFIDRKGTGNFILTEN